MGVGAGQQVLRHFGGRGLACVQGGAEFGHAHLVQFGGGGGGAHSITRGTR